MQKEQNITETEELYGSLIDIIKKCGSKRPFLVCGRSFMRRPVYDMLMKNDELEITAFHDYEPNPKYESVVKGLKSFRENDCDLIISAGGGSPMDVAKSIKAFIRMDDDVPYISQKIIPNAVPHIAVPSTAGTGSESTHFAVIYYEGKKCSVSDDSLLSEYVILDPALLEGLPEYQRKATMMDALCHAIESFWSVKSTEESRKKAAEAVKEVIGAHDAYLSDTPEGNRGMLRAANLAGQAINMTTTTAAHAMCYKLTSMYGIAHGHAAALCLPKLWRYMIENDVKIQDPRGREYVDDGFNRLAALLGSASPLEAAAFIERFIDELGLKAPESASEEDIEELAGSVNAQRLSNNPAALSSDDLKKIYQMILKV